MADLDRVEAGKRQNRGGGAEGRKPARQPGNQNHENEPGRHEAESRKYAALPASGQHAEVDAEFVRFGPWECLINSEDPVEALPGDPLLLLHYLLTDHRDLGHWPAPRQQPEPEEPKKKRSEEH